MSEPITLKQQVAFMASTLKTCETSYPIKVEMGRLSKADAERGLAKMRAVLDTLRKAETAGGIVKQAVQAVDELAPLAGVDQLARLQAAMTEIHKCARDHSDECLHCRSIANLLGEMGIVTQ